MREKRLLEEALQRALRGGVRRAEAFYSATSGRVVEYADRGLETYRGASGRGLGLRVFRRGRAGFSYGQDFTAAGLERLAARAAEAAGLADLPAFPTPRGWAVAADLGILDAAGLAAPVSEDRDRLEEIVRRTRAAHPDVRRIKKVSLSCRRRETRLLSTTGTELESVRSAFTLAAGVVAGRAGESEMGWESDTATARDALDWSDVGPKAAAKAAGRLGARPAVPGRQRVILDREVVAEFLSFLGAALSADAVLKKKSLYANLLGTLQASAAVTLVDDPTLHGAAGSAPFDDEGQPTRPKALFRAGVLEGYLHTLETAHRMETPPTGNGFRRDFASLPLPRPGNLVLEPGPESPEDWQRSAGGLLTVDEILGAHTMNPVSGDFSVGASGFRHDHGSRRPFRGVTIAGNLRELFFNVVGVGRDLRFFGEIGAPSLLVDGLHISA